MEQSHAMLDTALKEWAIICDLLAEGSLAILLRKGGIHETAGPGVFELERPRFVLYPSWAHQQPAMLKPPWRGRVTVLDEPAEVTLQAVGEVGRIWQVDRREVLDTLDDLHPWSPQYLDMRFNYKPDRPLYLLAVRVSRLNRPCTICAHAQYAGCRSWIALRPGDEVDDQDARPVLDDDAFNALVTRIDKALGASA